MPTIADHYILIHWMRLIWGHWKVTESEIHFIEIRENNDENEIHLCYTIKSLVIHIIQYIKVITIKFIDEFTLAI